MKLVTLNSFLKNHRGRIQDYCNIKDGALYGISQVPLTNFTIKSILCVTGVLYSRLECYNVF